MTDDSILCLEEAEEGMKNSIDHLKNEFQKIRAGKASPNMLSGVLVDYYGMSTPIERTSNINTPDARMIVVQPFDKSTIQVIEKAIMNAGLGFNPQSDGELIRISVPPLTEERRLGLVKQAKAVTEDTKIGIRNCRRQANEEAKKLEKEGVSEDEIKQLLDEIQKQTDSYSKRVDDYFEMKEKEIITI
jgi:ribosome recycling factor